jgi:Uma2 family endonuclease
LPFSFEATLLNKTAPSYSAPELVVEVLSPANTRAERAEKLHDYESLGVPEVWVVSPEAQTVEVLLLQDGHLTTTTLLRQGQLKPTHFPEAAVDIASIWTK